MFLVVMVVSASDGIFLLGVEVKVGLYEAFSTSNNSTISASNSSVVVFTEVVHDFSICFEHAKFLFSHCRHFCPGIRSHKLNVEENHRWLFSLVQILDHLLEVLSENWWFFVEGLFRFCWLFSGQLLLFCPVPHDFFISNPVYFYSAPIVFFSQPRFFYSQPRVLNTADDLKSLQLLYENIPSKLLVSYFFISLLICVDHSFKEVGYAGKAFSKAHNR